MHIDIILVERWGVDGYSPMRTSRRYSTDMQKVVDGMNEIMCRQDDRIREGWTGLLVWGKRKKEKKEGGASSGLRFFTCHPCPIKYPVNPAKSWYPVEVSGASCLNILCYTNRTRWAMSRKNPCDHRLSWSLSSTKG